MKSLLLAAILLVQAPPQRAITGQLSYEDQSPAKMVAVAAVPVVDPGRPTPFARSYPTEENGTFKIPNLTPGRYQLRATLSSDLILYYPETLTVTAGADIDAVNFVLPATASGVKVSGRVRFPTDKPQVQLANMFGGAQRTAAVADDGAFFLAHIQEGTYLLTAGSPGFLPIRLAVGKNEVSGLDLNLPPLIVTAGMTQVEGANSRPPFKLAFDSPIYRITLDVGVDGKFSTPLPPATYRVSIAALPTGYYVKSFKAGTADLLASRFKVSDGSSPAALALTLARSDGVSVAGKVIGAGNPPAGFTRKLRLEGMVSDETAETTIQPDGSFEFAKLMPNAYLARVTLTAAVASPALPVLVPDSNLKNLTIEVPPPTEITGRVTVDGFGQPPKFTLLLLHDVESSSAPTKVGQLPELSLPISRDAMASFVRDGGAGAQALQVNIDALPDGSFKLKLPLGDYRVFAGSPSAAQAPQYNPAYVLRSIRYGSADLMKEPLTISDSETKEIQVEFGTAAPSPWVRLKGRVIGFDPVNAPFRVALEGSGISTVESLVNADGSFEFPAVLPQTTYTARLLPATPEASMPRVTVKDKDVSDVEIQVPHLREISGEVTMDTTAPPPGFTLSLSNTSSSMVVLVRPDAGSRFRIQLPDDERKVRLAGLPLGYSVTSMTYGATDLLKDPLKAADGSAELHISLSTDPAAHPARVSGRITGLDTSQGSLRISLNGVTAVSQFDAPLDASGAFSFSDIPQGAYFVSVRGMMLSPPSIGVGGMDLVDLQFAAIGSAPASSDEGPAGASVVDLSSGNNQAANESAAVASLRTVETAEVTYLSMHKGRYGGLPDLVTAGLLASRFAGIFNGYTFQIISLGSTFEVAAIPVSPDAGRYCFYGTPDGVIRYSTYEPLAPPGLGGNPVG